MERRAPRVTIADVARNVGVSTATVSLVLNERTEGVRISDATRATVRDAAARLGYTPNHAARSLRQSRTGSVTLLVATLHNPFFMDIVAGAQAVITAHGYDLNIIDSSTPGAKLRAFAHLRGGGADGVIVATGHLTTRGPDSAALMQLVERGIPAVMTLDYSPETTIPAVRADNEQSAALATAHFVALGHRRIGFLALEGFHPPGQYEDARADRYRGFRRVLAETGVPFDPAWVWQGEAATLATGYTLMRDLLAAPPPRPTAVIAFNDLMAMGAIRACHEAGVRVPGEMAMLGIGGIEAGAFSVPTLSTVAFPRREIGTLAAETLLDLLGGAAPAERERVLPLHLIVRESCGGVPMHRAGGERG